MTEAPAAPRICLNMIVRDEAAIIARCLASVAPAIDCYVIVDTGSKDDTIERARATLAAHGIPGEVHRTTFIDFGTTRTEALELCRSSPASFDYILLVDADMELVIEDPDFRERLGDPAYELRQVGSISYRNCRLIQRSLDARYVGATHEYLAVGVQPRFLHGLFLLDHEAGSSRVEKTERDLHLLSAALERDPTDARAMFYLAQTLREAGELDEAAGWYEARIAAGGWDEEVWYSRWMLALCRRDDLEEALRLCVQAWQARPRRAEPLHTAARMLREQGQNARALAFAEEGARIPYPEHDRLFIDDRVYREGFDEEFSICGFYSLNPHHFERGRQACFSLALRRDVSELTRHGARANARFYARRVDALYPSTSWTRVAVATSEGWHPTNPSLVRDGDGWLAVVRTVNYRLNAGCYEVADEANVVRTLNWLVRLSDDLRVESASAINALAGAPVRPEASISGYEDCRLFRWRGAWWCSATVADRAEDGRREMMLLALDGEGNVAREFPLTPPEPGRHEKNWIPVVDGEDLLFVYLVDPTIVLRFDPDLGDVVVHRRHDSAWALDHLRGGSQAVPVDGGWLCLTHEVVVEWPRSYLHRFVLLAPDLRVRGVGEPFRLRDGGVEFAAGLARDGSRLVAAFGVNDGEAWLAELDLEEVLAKIMGSESGARVELWTVDPGGSRVVT